MEVHSTFIYGTEYICSIYIVHKYIFSAFSSDSVTAMYRISWVSSNDQGLLVNLSFKVAKSCRFKVLLNWLFRVIYNKSLLFSQKKQSLGKIVWPQFVGLKNIKLQFYIQLALPMVYSRILKYWRPKKAKFDWYKAEYRQSVISV